MIAESYLDDRLKALREYGSYGALELIQKFINNAKPDAPPVKFEDPNLDGLADVLLSKPLSEQLDGYVWLLRQKYQAEEEQDYERAARIRNCQPELEDVLYPYKNTEIYIPLEEFLETRMPKEQFARMYEKTLLNMLEFHGYPPLILAQPYVQIVIQINILKHLDYVEEYTEYLSERNLETTIRHRHGMRSNLTPKNQ